LITKEDRCRGTETKGKRQDKGVGSREEGDKTRRNQGKRERERLIIYTNSRKLDGEEITFNIIHNYTFR
jgi:hypothetical protein